MSCLSLLPDITISLIHYLGYKLLTLKYIKKMIYFN